MFRYSPRPIKAVSIGIQDDEMEVVDGLAMTPSQMDDLRQRGKSISVNNLSELYYDGSKNPSFDLPIDEMRGVDIGEMWQRSKSAKKNLSSTAVNKFDVNPVKS